MREPEGFLLVIGADIEGRRLTRLRGRPSSESRSPVTPKRSVTRIKNKPKMQQPKSNICTVNYK